MFDHHGFGFGGPFIWLGLIVLIVVVVLALVRAASREAPSDQNATGPARRILEERLARGEIDEEEFKRKRDLLDS